MCGKERGWWGYWEVEGAGPPRAAVIIGDISTDPVWPGFFPSCSSFPGSVYQLSDLNPRAWAPRDVLSLVILLCMGTNESAFFFFFF